MIRQKPFPSTNRSYFLGTVIPYILAEYVAEPSPPNSEAVHKSKNVLPEFPLKNAADLQLFELDCMVEKNLVQLLVLRNEHIFELRHLF